MIQGDPCVYDRYRWVRERLRPGDGRTLDVGAGNGGFALFAASIGNKSVGLSIDEGEMRDAERRAALCGIDNVEFTVHDLRKGPLHGGFDQVICLEVAEHLLDDEKLFRDIAVALRPGGRLLLTTPFAEHRSLRDETLSETEDGGHVRWGYSEARLRELCDNASLTPISFGFVSGVVSQWLTNLQRRLRPFGKQRLGWVAVFPFRVLQFLDRPLTRAMGFPHLCITLVAERAPEQMQVPRLRPASANISS
jgi:SAM-dependent methyltransferase